jgi:hypothetical protein
MVRAAAFACQRRCRGPPSRCSWHAPETAPGNGTLWGSDSAHTETPGWSIGSSSATFQRSLLAKVLLAYRMALGPAADRGTAAWLMADTFEGALSPGGGGARFRSAAAPGTRLRERWPSTPPPSRLCRFAQVAPMQDVRSGEPPRAFWSRPQRGSQPPALQYRADGAARCEARRARPRVCDHAAKSPRVLRSCSLTLASRSTIQVSPPDRDGGRSSAGRKDAAPSIRVGDDAMDAGLGNRTLRGRCDALRRRLPVAHRSVAPCADALAGSELITERVVDLRR